VHIYSAKLFQPTSALMLSNKKVSFISNVLCQGASKTQEELCISHDEVGPVVFVESNNVSSASNLASGEVEALTTSQCPEVPVVPLPLPLTSRVATRNDVTPNCERDHINEGDEMNLAQRHPRQQNCQLPMWYRDILPQSPPTIPLEMCEQLPGYVGSVIAPERPALPVHAVFRTPPKYF
jgi:hypothetical protein